MNKGIVDQEAQRRRDALRKLASTPEGRRLARASAERIVKAMRVRERAQLEAITPAEQLERLKRQWAEEDARDERLAEANARMEAMGDRPWQCQCRTVREFKEVRALIAKPLINLWDEEEEGEQWIKFYILRMTSFAGRLPR